MIPNDFHLRIGERDFELLTALDRCPLTAGQLCRLSQTFCVPFATEHNLRRRLRKLTRAGLVNKFPYAIACHGAAPNYYKLAQLGFLTLYGRTMKLPRKRFFHEINPGHHYHTFSLAEVIVHLHVTAARNNLEILHFARENSFKIVAEPFLLYPDGAFVVKRGDGKTFSFILELDNGTERVQSKQDTESIERKIRGYDAHQASFRSIDPDRYVVIFITTRSKQRLQNILNVASSCMTYPERKVFVGSELSSFLSLDPFVEPIFKDHRGLYSSLVPNQKSQDEKSSSIVRSRETGMVT